MIPKAIPMEIRHIVFLLVVFILYVIFGGLIFMLLESPEEAIKRKEIEGLLGTFSAHIASLNHSSINEAYIRQMIHKLLKAQDANLIDSYGAQSQYINWSFINSFFFAITVTTTIGYGHLTPSTFFGKIFCIVYALFGIPITGLLIGSLADRFSKLYSPKAISRNSPYQRQLSARFRMLQKGLISLVPWFFVFLIVPAIIFTAIEEWTFLDGFYYCFVTLSTIGFGDFVAGSFEKDYIWVYKILVVFWIIFGLAYLSMVLNFITQSLRSRHISNVMHSLRHRISVNQSLATGGRGGGRGRGHLGHFKRQQSSPVVLFSQNGKTVYHGHRTDTGETGQKKMVRDGTTMGLTLDPSHCKHATVLDMDLDPCPCTPKRSSNRSFEFAKFFKHLKPYSKNKSTVAPATPSNKNSVRSTREDRLQAPSPQRRASLRSSTSLPDLTADYISPSSSEASDDNLKITVV